MNKALQTSISYIKNEGIVHFLFAVILKLQNHRKRLAYKYIAGDGIEIGGLGNPLEVNTKVAKVKYVDYLPPEVLKTINEGIVNESPVTIDYLCKADNLEWISDQSQDFIIANHVFEHLDNPIKTLIEWDRVLKQGGIIYLTVPDKRRTFDKKRGRTSIEHIVSDYIEPSEERDFEHFKEFAEVLLDYKQKSNAKIVAEARRLKDINYSIHYHVFLEEDTLKILEYGKNQGLFSFKAVEIKHTSKWNIADIEFTLILQK